MKKLLYLLTILSAPILLLACSNSTDTPSTVTSVTPAVGSTFYQAHYSYDDRGNIDSSGAQPDSIVIVTSADTTIFGRSHVSRFSSYYMIDQIPFPYSEIDLQRDANGNLNILDWDERLGFASWRTLPIQTQKLAGGQIDTLVPGENNTLFHINGTSVSAYIGTAEIPVNGTSLHTIVTTDTLRLTASNETTQATLRAIYTYYYAPSIGYFAKRTLNWDAVGADGNPQHSNEAWLLQRYTLK